MAGERNAPANRCLPREGLGRFSDAAQLPGGEQVGDVVPEREIFRQKAADFFARVVSLGCLNQKTPRISARAVSDHAYFGGACGDRTRYLLLAK